MRIVSVNVAGIREVAFGRRRVRTGIFKKPVSGAVAVRRLGLEGDRQADLRVHGGPDKAVYIYAADHYATWAAELGRDLAYGGFGENLTIEGATEEEIRLGDILLAGTALLQVTQPRAPCFKLGIAMDDQRFIRRFLASGRTGFYASVLQEGAVQAGDDVVIVERSSAPTIAEVVLGASPSAA